MKKKLLFIALLLVGMTAVCAAKKEKGKFVKVDGVNLVKPNGEKLFIVGTNLGNWLNPEGYMFGFQRTNCEWMINDMLSQMVGPDFTAEFW